MKTAEEKKSYQREYYQKSKAKKIADAKKLKQQEYYQKRKAKRLADDAEAVKLAEEKKAKQREYYQKRKDQKKADGVKAKSRERYQKNKTTILATARARYHSDPEHRAKVLSQSKAANKKSYAEDPTPFKKRNAEYYQRNKAKIYAQTLEYKRANPEKCKEWNQKYYDECSANPVCKAKRAGKARVYVQTQMADPEKRELRNERGRTYYKKANGDPVVLRKLRADWYKDQAAKANK